MNREAKLLHELGEGLLRLRLALNEMASGPIGDVTIQLDRDTFRALKSHRMLEGIAYCHITAEDLQKSIDVVEFHGVRFVPRLNGRK